MNARTTQIFNIMSGRDSYYGKTSSGILSGMLDWLNNAGFITYADGFCAPESGVTPAISQTLADYVFTKSQDIRDSIEFVYYTI